MPTEQPYAGPGSARTQTPAPCRTDAHVAPLRSGGEFRHNPHNYGSGFGLILDHPEALVVVNHVINTYGTTRHTYDGADGWSSPFIECPCTSRRTKQCDLSPQEIDHCVVAPPFQCNEAFTKTNNPACNCTT